MTTTFGDARSQQYIRSHFTRETPLLRELREHTHQRPDSFLQITPDQGAALAMLVGATGARKVLEIGVYTGYSAIWMASALSDGGRLIACDIDPDMLAIAKPYFEKAGLNHKIECSLGPALSKIEELIAKGQSGSFDLVFIDADKEPIEEYYEGCLKLVRLGGLIVIDNVLWEGKVADLDSSDPDAEVMRAITHKATKDPRVDSCVLSVGDGLLVVRRIR